MQISDTLGGCGDKDHSRSLADLRSRFLDKLVSV